MFFLGGSADNLIFLAAALRHIVAVACRHLTPGLMSPHPSTLMSSNTDHGHPSMLEW